VNKEILCAIYTKSEIKIPGAFMGRASVGSAVALALP
jgi:hypothetical protein